MMEYRFCGRSGLRLPVVSLGMWHNFGDTDCFATAKEVAFEAFSSGVFGGGITGKFPAFVVAGVPRRISAG